MEGRKVRDPEPPTLAFRLKSYKAAMQQLRCVVRSLKENTTVSFLPTPALVVQTVKNQFVSKIVFNSSCLYITDRSFTAKTINNFVPLIGNLMYLTSNRDLTKFSVQDTSSLSARICMSAPDYHMEFSSACVHNQDIIRETSDSAARVDLDCGVVGELIKWIAPHIKPKRNSKKQPTSTSTVQITLHATPPTVKFSLGGSSELEFTANNRVAFHEVKNLRVTVQARNLQQALCNCAVTKLTCTLRVMTDHEPVLYVASKNSAFAIENFLSEEPFVRSEADFDRAPLANFQNSGSSGGDDFATCSDHNIDTCKKHDRSSRKGGDDHSGKDKYDQHKITSFMVSKASAGGGSGGNSTDRGTYFNDAKEESDSDEDSVTFDYTPSAKKQKCCP
uniref:DNA polymerase processivity factor n=1 Tax=Mastomys natalensis cytomegalovirus 2 TaxID=2973540 RepID=A0A9Y1IKZ0_9BETA|nr:DNA polymerase processivity subunit [Mastomys natalensis cytomegalovirus 2]WEG69188.1 DNA polymerase processivity subunit [Mastomys natalensis cytomegalovirus 2]WEG69327.1 DNA polymerase processivity subunit [Mastomys natalensis cytomegalovirus 2]WEG69465.1 DNA polymerase processivity subunit [Mastomys natalensis cytomegalovirus 2]WEG69603.1 DNA polymerase processivity subunit [Mastomys natalensis cytomegalovirus 2]